VQRQCLAINENFEPYSAFQRLDRNESGFIASRDIINYIRDNGLSDGITEADCYYLVKYFDSDEDGKLHYADFMTMLLPCSDSKLRAQATQRPNIILGKFDYLTLDVEKELAELMLSEISLHRHTETLKQQLASCKGFDLKMAYYAVDDCAMQYVYQKNLERFFTACKRKTTEQDHYAIIRRMDVDSDSKVN
jgi:Ca2+-binding EF-hand superfamily protein